MRRVFTAVALLSLGCGSLDVDVKMPQPQGCPSVVPTIERAEVRKSDAVVVVPELTAHTIAIPNSTGNASLDYIAYERGTGRVWIPVGKTGSVDVFDIAAGAFTVVGGFKNEEREVKGKKRWMGPSAVSIGEGFAYIGDRASNEICPIDLKTLKPAACIKLNSKTDGVVYVAASKEVWVNTPDDAAIVVLDASKPPTLKQKTTIKTPGEPEGYAVDEARGLFFTNLEDKGPTLAIDVATKSVKWTWNAGCGSDGPRGLVWDAPHGFVVVACTDHVQVLDGKDGHALGKLEVGAGVDNLDIVGDKLYAAAGKTKGLTVVKVDDKGVLSIVASATTAEGARNAVADDKGNVYVGDAQGSKLMIFGALH